MNTKNGKLRDGFCIFLNTFLRGPVPCVSDESNYVVFDTECEAQREIADHMITRIQEFLDGAREFEDAIDVQEFAAPVSVLSDGTIIDAHGNCFDLRVE